MPLAKPRAIPFFRKILTVTSTAQTDTDLRSLLNDVLGLGPVSLTVLEAAVREWVATQR